jgi:hypothetical protein
MNELTKKQKLEVVELAIKRFEELPQFLCNLLDNCIYDLGYYTEIGGYTNNMIIKVQDALIPEFSQFKPKDKKRENAWFKLNQEGNEKRLEILNELYKLIKKQL